MVELLKPNAYLNRYLVVGGLAFFSEYLSFILLYRAVDISLVLANATSFCIGLLTSFLLNRLWTFSTKTYRRRAAHQFGYYVALAMFNLLATLALVSILKAAGVNPNIGKLVAMAITSIWNFAIFQRFIFKHAS
jgi:putative flippase GtrA